MTPVKLDPAAPRSRVKHSTTEPLRSLIMLIAYEERTQANTISADPEIFFSEGCNSDIVFLVDEGREDQCNLKSGSSSARQ